MQCKQKGHGKVVATKKKKLRPAVTVFSVIKLQLLRLQAMHICTTSHDSPQNTPFKSLAPQLRDDFNYHLIITNHTYVLCVPTQILPWTIMIVPYLLAPFKI